MTGIIVAPVPLGLMDRAQSLGRLGTSIHQAPRAWALTNAERRRLPAWVRGTQQTPQVTLRKPVTRHYPRHVQARDQGERGNKNTMIDPRVVTDQMILDEVEAINRGEAIVDRQHGTAWINGRLYGYHTDTGTAYPMRREGFVEMDQRQYSALRMTIRYHGLNEESEFELKKRPNLTDEDRDLIRYVWRMREDAEN